MNGMRILNGACVSDCETSGDPKPLGTARLRCARAMSLRASKASGTTEAAGSAPAKELSHGTARTALHSACSGAARRSGSCGR